MVFKEVVETNSFWTPEKKGDTVIGTLIEIAEGKYGKIYHLEQEKGVITVPTWTILKSKMVSVDIGQKVKIVFEGEITTPNGMAKDFTVYVDDGKSAQ